MKVTLMSLLDTERLLEVSTSIYYTDISLLTISNSEDSLLKIYVPEIYTIFEFKDYTLSDKYFNITDSRYRGYKFTFDYRKYKLLSLLIFILKYLEWIILLLVNLSFYIEIMKYPVLTIIIFSLSFNYKAKINDTINFIFMINLNLKVDPYIIMGLTLLALVVPKAYQKLGHWISFIASLMCLGYNTLLFSLIVVSPLVYCLLLYIPRTNFIRK